MTPRDLTLLLGLTSGLAACTPPVAPMSVGGARAGEGVSTAMQNQQVRFGVLLLTPMRVEEDSRCPQDVQCVHAGTVRVAVRFTEGGAGGDAVLTLNQPTRLGAIWVRLAAVCPVPRLQRPIAAADYRFTFVASTDSPPPPLAHACPRP